MSIPIKVTESKPQTVQKTSLQRLESLPTYPSGQYLYYDWQHDEYETDKVYETRNGKPTDVKPKAFIRNAENGNI